MKALVYVAGPYSSNPVANTTTAVHLAEILERRGVDVVVPHLTLLWDLIAPAPVERWYERDLAILARCDALYRFAGESTGADREVAFAKERGLPVFTSLSELEGWAQATSRSSAPPSAEAPRV